MTRAIHKFPIVVDDLSTWTINMPRGAIFRHIGFQGGAQDLLLMTWWEVDLGALPLSRTFVVVGTGHPIPNGYRYLGTAVGKAFVWHLYEEEG